MGDNVCIELRGNICGDILVFVSPKNRIEGGNITDLIITDTKLEKQVNLAFSNFRLKTSGLTLLPTSLVWIANIGISTVFLGEYSNAIYTSFAGNEFMTGIGNTLPVVVLTAVTVLFGKQLGSLIMKPLFAIITRIVRLVRKFRNRKVSEMNG